MNVSSQRDSNVFSVSAAAALAITLAALVASPAAAAQEMPAAAAETHDAVRMNPYTGTISYPLAKDTMMLMVLPDFQSARSTRNFATGMLMLEYGVTSQWTVGLMVEGQKIEHAGHRLGHSF